MYTATINGLVRMRFDAGQQVGIVNDKYDPHFSRRKLAEADMHTAAPSTCIHADAQDDSAAPPSTTSAPTVVDSLNSNWYGNAAPTSDKASPPSFFRAVRSLYQDVVMVTFFSAIIMYTDLLGVMGRRKELLRRSLAADQSDTRA